MKKQGALSKPLILAVDWHDEMYCGDPTAEGVVGAVRKNGSNYAYRFATANVLVNGQRLTLELEFLIIEYWLNSECCFCCSFGLMCRFFQVYVSE
jgi:hypothetical protein